MLLAPLFGAALAVAVSTEPLNDLSGKARPPSRETAAATEPLVHSATECIVRAVVADPRYANLGGGTAWGSYRRFDAGLSHTGPRNDRSL
jgi:hypothetical protein